MSEKPLFDAEAFALDVRVAMARENISYRLLAAKIGVDQATLHRCAKHATTPSIETYLRLNRWLIEVRA